MKQIVCLSTSPWYPIPTRKQQVMSRLPDAQICYFDPPVTWLAPLKDKSARKKLRAYRAGGQKVQPNLTVYALPPVLPFFNRFRLINRINQKRLARYVRRCLRENGFEEPVLWTYSPTSCDFIDHLPHSALIYDCVDRHSAYGGQMNPALVDQMEAELAGKADAVFATADSLCRRLAQYNRTACFIPNGANFERFVQAAQPQPVPAELADMAHPIFGFVGALQSCICYDYVRYAAAQRPQWQFVFIGRQQPGVDLSELEALENVHFLGLKPNEELPAYLAQFDACLNLFASSELSKEVSPLKFYEYLATGKPIVSTPQPEQVLQYESLIHIAGSPEAFVQACEQALDDAQPERTQARIAAGRESSWDTRVEQICRRLRELGVF